MSVMMQAFHWDCPRVDGAEHGWWRRVSERIPALASAGFNCLWLPPAHKAGNIGGPSMGYDPYDYYDLGEFDQKGAVPTWFGTRDELRGLIVTAHTHGLKVLADMVVNHCNGADGQEVNPITGQERWTLFQPRSGKFPRGWECFHPNSYERWDEGVFGEMPDLSHHNPYVYWEILKLARWLVEEIGFDGFRYDFVKGYGAHTVRAIQEYRYVRDGKLVQPYGVAEHWSAAQAIEQWADVTNFSAQNPVDAFDFPLREMLKGLCDRYGFSLRDLVSADTLLRRQARTAVTFVENHDLREGDKPIVHDKLLAYSFILSHEGYPCVFWKDWYNYDLAQEGTPYGIAALVASHGRYAGGGTQILALDDDLYVMERSGYGQQPGLVYALNNRGDRWYGARVACRWPNTTLRPVAWWSAADRSRPEDKITDEDGVAEFWAPPRGYVVYVPQA